MKGQRLPLKAQKALTALEDLWTVVTPAFAAAGSECLPLEETRDAVRDFCRSEMRAPDSSSLSEWLERLAIQIEQTIIFSQSNARVCKSTVNGFIAALRAHDDSEEEGPRRLSAELYHLAAAEYSRATARNVPDGEPMLDVGWTRGAFIRSYQDRFKGTAVTTISEDLNSRISLSLAPATYDDATYNSLPYVLFHELICHVFQGPWVGSRRTSDAASLYAEGWMDVVALTLLRQHAGECTRSDLHPTDGRHHLDRSLDAAEAVRQARLIAPAGLGFEDSAWAARETGSSAAATVRMELIRMLGNPRGSRLFIDVSLELNASDVPPCTRDEVAKLAHTVSFPDRRAHLRFGLGRYVIHRDIPGLLSDLPAILVRLTNEEG